MAANFVRLAVTKPLGKYSDKNSYAKGYSIGGLCGFGASVLAGKLLGAVQERGNHIFGIRIYGQQLLSAISLLLVIAAVLFTRRVIEKQPVTVR